MVIVVVVVAALLAAAVLGAFVLMRDVRDPVPEDQGTLPDSTVTDRDNDGHPDPTDAFPDDPSEWSDGDGDGIGDNADPLFEDLDNDGFPDATDLFKDRDVGILVSLYSAKVLDRVDALSSAAQVYFTLSIDGEPQGENKPAGSEEGNTGQGDGLRVFHHE